jgi:hypothetical protein
MNKVFERHFSPLSSQDKLLFKTTAFDCIAVIIRQTQKLSDSDNDTQENERY